MTSRSLRRCTAVAAVLFVLANAPAATAQTSCAAPGTPQIIFTPPGNVAVGQTYAIVWSDAADLDSDGYYIVERSTSSSFAQILDSQQTFSTAASFTSSSEGTFHHRVRAFAGCDGAAMSAFSATRAVNVVAGRPNVVITVQPKPVIVAVGESLASQRATMIVENIGKATVTVSAPAAPIGSNNFFTVSDPEGELNSGFLTLAPRQPKRLDVSFLSNVSTSAPASFQGFIFLVGQPEPLAVTPYAFVNLKIGASGNATPVFKFSGLQTEYVFFPGYPTSQPDSARPLVTVQIENPGDTPMELGGEVGPEVWLIPNTGWNATAIPPHGTRNVELRVDRSKVPTGSALPRYTYFTIRSRDGKSARLLVQDNDVPAQDTGRQPLDAAVRSYVVPQVTTLDTAAGRGGSRIRLSNVGGAALTADVYFTPTGSDGSSGSVRRASIIVPPNDVVTLTDPLNQIFGLSPPASGQAEVRAAADKVAFLTVNADVFVPAAGGGTNGYSIPVLQRGEGARTGAPHKLVGITGSPNVRASVVVVETSGEGVVNGTLQLFSQDGQRRGDLPFSVLRYGHTEITDVLTRLGATTGIESGRFDVYANSGRGAATALLILTDPQKQRGAALVSQNAPNTGVAAGKRGFALATSRLYIVPGAINGNPANIAGLSLSTIFSMAAASNVETAFRFVLLGSTSPSPLLRIPAGQSLEATMAQIFALSGNAQGSVTIETTSDAVVNARLASAVGGSSPSSLGAGGGALPVVTSLSEALTAARSGMKRPVYVDGVEQSTDSSRGRRWDLLLSEVTGSSANVIVRMYESGNRTSPIAEKTFALAANEQRRLSTIFAAMDLDTDDRRKDRTNVQVVVVPDSGDGIVVAVAQAVDNRTGDTTSRLLTPSGGVLPTGVSKVTARVPGQAPASSTRRRAVGP